MKIILATILFTSAALAQDEAAIAKAKAACGPEKTTFDVSIDHSNHPAPQPEAGKAVVFLASEVVTNYFKHSAFTARIGINGNWIGALKSNTYIYFSVEPGEQHLCANWQSRLSSRNERVTLANFTAEAGKTYYIRLRGSGQGQDLPPLIDLELINSDEGQLLVASSPLATSQAKGQSTAKAGADSSSHQN